mmetsp:Transcript_20680/g.43512  ORF Transcript_20680/g.43512 Transcript_20680/m.43512 type:complete len:132 (+) Transcript_20680:286-681(+)
MELWPEDVVATDWAKNLASTCTNKPPQGIVYGVNSQGFRGGEAPSAEASLRIWENKIDKGYPTNIAITQALWRPTEYVGCGSASSGEGDCTYMVCFYTKPGNCNMGKYGGWEEPTFANDSGCRPSCTPEGC